mgnify:CR=1 FL=1
MEVLIKPVITEKMTAMADKFNRFGFVVDKRANKLQIKNTVQDMYSVSVTEVNTMVMPGKKRTRNTKTKFIVGRKPAYKKAVVTLAEGDTIDFYSNI